MYVTISSSHNLIQDLSVMMSKEGITPRVYFTLFETEYQTNLLKRALDILQLPVSGVLLDESLVNLRRADLRDNIIKVSKTWGYPVVSLADIEKQENVVIVVLNDPNYYHLMVDFFEKHQLNCRLFHYSEIKMSNYRLYVPNENQWDKACGTDYYNPRKPGYRIIKNAIIEPPKHDVGLGVANLYRGGICDEKGHFITGFKRYTKVDKANYCIYDSYEPVGEIEYLSGNYIFGGVLIDVFGHTISDSLANLWWTVKNKDNQDKIIFLNLCKNVQPIFWKIAEILEIKERIIVVEKLCQVDQIIVPDDSFKAFAEYTDEMTTVYNAVASVILEKSSEDKLCKKIYLTKSQFSSHDSFGAKFFDDFYRKRGFEIIAPETLPFEEQIRILNYAEEIVCSIGSMSHMLLFANNNKKKVTFLLRANEIVGCSSQLMMNQATGINYNIVDTSINFLPTVHAGGVFLVGPTQHFINYLNDNEFSYETDEVQMDWSCLHEYLVAYTNNYNRDYAPYRRIKDLDMFDVINQMNFIFNGTHLDRNKMHTKSKLQLQKELGHAVIKFGYHFSKIGWLNEIENLQPVVKPYQMEAIQINNPYPDCKIECQVKQQQIGWQSSENKNGNMVCGQTGKSLAITAVCLKIGKDCNNYEILYRAYMKTTGWTKICSDGEICGSISEESEDIIMGMQIILINNSMNNI